MLHPCCHNPTGEDLTKAQWDQVIQVVKDRGLIPFLDIAYQGFGDGMESDAYAIRAMAGAGLSFLVSNSYSKILLCTVSGLVRSLWSVIAVKPRIKCWDN